jgi:ribosomal protein S18 acetylase RimI-like enzyme
VGANEPEHRPVEVRPARQSDIDALLVVEQQCFDVYYYDRYQLGRDDFQGYLEDTSCVFLVAARAVWRAGDEKEPPPEVEASDSRVIGYVLGPVDSRRMRRSAHIDSIAVLPEVQHEGIGSRLLQAFIEQARQHGARTLTLEVALANAVGRAFFAKHGFHEVRPLLHYYGRTLHGLLLSTDV